MAMTVQELRTASNAIRDHVKMKNVDAMIQEYQMMGLYDQYFIAANYKRASRLIPDNVKTIQTIPGLRNRVTAIVRAPSAAVAAGKLSAKTLIIIDGASSEGNIIHAEQTLLLTLCFKLKGGMTAPNVAIGGCKVACSKCFTVLQAFAKAYKQEYKKVLDYEESRLNAYNTNGDAKIKKIDLGGTMGDVSSWPGVADLLKAYKTALI